MIDIDFEKLKQILPYFGGVLIPLGYFKLSLFYSHFNVNISEYIDISEMLTAFIPDLSLFISIIFLFTIFDFITKSKEQIITENEKDSKILNEAIFYKRFHEFVKQHLALFSCFLIIIIINIFVNRSIYQNLYFLYLAIILLTKFIFLEYNVKYKSSYDKYLSNSTQNIIYLVFIMIITSFYLNYTNIEMIEKSNQVNVCFKISDNVIQTDSNLIFVGQTNKFLFMHDKSTDETFVYPREEIKDMTIRKIKKS